MLIFSYNSYIKKQKLYNNRIYIAYLQKVHHDIVKNLGKNKFSKIEFESYVESNYDYDFIEWLGNLNYRLDYQYESILIYDFGFDNNDDSCRITYKADSISFIKSLFIDGDIILYEGFADFSPYSNKDSLSVNRYPPIPIQFPKKVLDSLNNLDSTGVVNLRKNYKNFYYKVLHRIKKK
jgi:hypothetical protein